MDEVDELIKKLLDEDSDVRKKVVEALVKIGKPAVDQLIAALREAAAKSGPFWWTIIPGYLPLPLDEYRRVQKLAEALGEIGDPKAVEPLIVTLRDENWGVRRAAAKALGNIGDKRAVESLIAALRDKNEEVREAAAEALEKIDPNWHKTEEAKRQMPQFIAALRDEDWLIRGTVAEILGEIKDPEVVKPLIITALRDEDDWVQKVAKEALDKLCAPSLKAYPHLLCETCHLRTEEKEVKFGITSYTYVACRICGNPTTLITGIEEVIGLIGGDVRDCKRDGEVFYVNLWDEDKKDSRNADIDKLMIINTDGISYDWAIASVITTLKNNTSRPPEWLKTIPVILKDNPKIPEDSIAYLQRTFKEVVSSP